MSNEPVVPPVEDNQVPAEQDPKPNTVAYDSYKKVLAEKKKAQADKDELARKLKEYEDEKLAAQGKSNELNESLRNQLKEEKEQKMKIVGAFAEKTVKASIEAEAKKQGCVDTELLIKAVDMGALEVNTDDFTVNQDDLSRQLDAVKTKHPWLFNKGGPKLNDGLPGSAPKGETFTASKLSSLKQDDLKKLLAMKLAQK